MHVLIPALHRPTKPTGVCRYAANLAQCLAETSDVTDVTLVVGAWQRHYFETSFSFTSEKIRLVSVEIKNSALARNSWYLFGLPKLTASFQPDIVHVSFPFPFLRSRFSCPVVSTIHDLYPYECPENFGFPQVLFNRLFLKQCINSSDGISCVSGTTLDRLKLYFPTVAARKNCIVAYNTVDFSHVQPQAPDSTKLDPDSSFLLCVAQHRKNKNLDLLINAYAQLMKQNQLNPATKLVLVGSSGPETENLNEQIRSLNLHKHVLLFSSIHDPELCWLYQHCELFAIASSTEGFCLPLAEALSLSCKVVCSDIPVLREIGSSECTYFQLTGDRLSNLSHAIRQTLSQSQTAALPTGFRFSKAAVAKDYLTFYSKILER